ncbi:monooxygenase [Pleodorina starrii]|nr:monooxygenase [Pleodorina starrii]
MGDDDVGAGAKVASRKLAAVIGAGVAGCQAARALLRVGYDVLVLEQGRGLGGVWRRNYHSFGLQVPWTCYTFPEFPYDKAPRELAERAEREGYPSGETVKEYIAAYCAHFDLERHILYGAKVVHLGALPGGRWSVRFRQAESPAQPPAHGSLKIMEVDLVVMATGMYYSPYVPSVPGLASFKGTVLHARDFVSVERLAGKRVLVLGAGKSATDCAVVAASPAAGAATVTSLFRQAHWPLPRRLFGLPFHRLVYTRFAAAMLPMYYTGQGHASKRLKHGLLSPLKRLFWTSLEGHVARKMRLRGQLRPELGFVQDSFFGSQIQDGAWNEAVNAGRISAVQGSLAEVRPGGVRLSDGTSLDCDVIIFATGYTKDYSLFDAATAGRLMAAAGNPGAEAGLHLYRSVMSPWVPNLYFIGCEASSFNNMLTSGLQSLWMAHHVTGRLQLPSPQETMKDIQRQRAWRKSVMPPQHYCASSIMLFQQRYHDQLVRDLGASPKRKRATRRGGCEAFGVYTSEDYADLFADGAAPGLAAAAAAAPPPRPADAVVAAAVTLMPAAAAIVGARLDLAVMPGGGGGGGAAAAAARRQVAAVAALVPVCTEHSDAVAIAVAPGDDAAGAVGSGAGGVAPSGLSSAFISSFDSPTPKHLAAATAAADGGSAAAAVTVVQTAKPASRLQPIERTMLSPPEGPLGDGGGGGADGAAAAAATAAVIDSTTTTADGGRSSAVATGAMAASTLSDALPSGSASVAGGAAGGGDALSALSTNTALGAASVTGSAAAAGATGTLRRVTLATRVRLQVLHLVQRTTGGGMHSAAASGATGGVAGGAAAATAEEVLELGPASSTTLTQQRMLDGSPAVTMSQAHLNGNGGCAGGAVQASGGLQCDNMRHAAPNVYNELVGTLGVH